MFRRSRSSRLLQILWIASIALVAPNVAARAQVEEVPEDPHAALENYLLRLDLKDLLAEHLHARLNEVDRRERVEIAERLADLYVALLRETADHGRRAHWERQARDLLARVPEADSTELRLDLLRAAYSQAEEAAERWRLRLANEQEKGETLAAVRTLQPQFDELASRIHQRVESLEREEERGSDSEELIAELGEARRLRSLAFYYAGWCDYYIAFLADADRPAVEAMKHFGWLLNSRGGTPASLDRLPDALLRYEHVARAAIGCALSLSQRNNDAEALAWLDQVEKADDLPPAVADNLLAWRIMILARARRWADLERTVRIARNSDRFGGGPDVQPLDVTVARLLVVASLEADRRLAPDLIERIAAAGMADLVAHGQIAHILDLANRYGTASLGQEGFIVNYVRGLRDYELARAAQREAGENAEEPTGDREIASKYRAAAQILEGTLVQEDADSFPREQAQAALLIGYARFFVGEFIIAAEWFDRGHREAASAQQAEEALWLAVIALDRAVDDGADAMRARRDQAAALYLQTYPTSERAARLLLRDATADLVDIEKATEILLSVPRGSNVYEAARRQAARLLYNIFRRSRGASREFAALRFAEVAEEVVATDRRTATAGTDQNASDAAARVVILCRQLLDALLSVTTPDADRAERVLNALEHVRVYQNIDLAKHEPELLYRRIQIAIARDRDDEANAHIQRLRALPDGRVYADAADILLYRRALERWKRASEPAVQIAAAAELVGHGMRILERTGSDPASLDDGVTLGIHLNVAQAATQIADAQEDSESRQLAIRLDEAVLAAHPFSEDSLRRLAGNAEAVGDGERALECWRSILAALHPGSDAWFEARYESLRLLAAIDPKRATEALAQHLVLYPEYGPSPWGDRIKALERSIPSAVEGAR